MRGFLSLVLCLGLVLCGDLAFSGKARKAKRERVVRGVRQLKVEILGLRNNRGQVLVLLFRGAKGFPSKPKSSFLKVEVLIKKRKASAVFKGLPKGWYALSVVHDQNKNFKMDRNVLGVPKEGFGVSNNVKSMFGPPKFKAASFFLRRKKQRVQIKLRYW